MSEQDWAEWDARVMAWSGSVLHESTFARALLAAFPEADLSCALGLFNTAVVSQALVLPQKRYGLTRWRTWQPSQAPISFWVHAPAIKTHDLARAFLRASSLRTLTLDITQLDSRYDLFASGQGNEVSHYIDSGWIDLPDNAEMYFAARGKNLRHNLKRQRARLAEGNVTTALEVCHSVADCLRALNEFFRLESAGWKAQNGTAVGRDNAQGHFYRRLIERYASLGRARLFLYRFDGDIVAADVCLVQGTEMIVLKTAYDESRKPFSPALLMREEAIRYLIEKTDIRRVEFYGKMLDWHAQWTATHRPLFHLTAYRTPMLRQLAQFIRKTRSAYQRPI